MATFNAVFLGAAVESRTAAAPAAKQLIEYPALNGVGVNVLGGRGAYTEVHGVLCGTTILELTAAEETFRQMQVQAITATLMIDYPDGSFLTWANVMIVDFQTEGSIGFAPGWGWARPYTAMFFHPTY